LGDKHLGLLGFRDAGAATVELLNGLPDSIKRSLITLHLWLKITHPAAEIGGALGDFINLRSLIFDPIDRVPIGNFEILLNALPDHLKQNLARLEMHSDMALEVPPLSSRLAPSFPKLKIILRAGS
jgi:hypothetical protein